MSARRLLVICILLLEAACQAASPPALSPTSTTPVQNTPVLTPVSTAGMPVTSTAPIPSPAIQTISPAPSSTPGQETTGLPDHPTQINSANAAALAPVLHKDFGAWSQVLRLAWSPDGGSLAVSAGEGLHILEVPALEERLAIQMDTDAPDIAYSPDGKSLAAIDRNGMLWIWDAGDGSRLQSLQAHQKSGSAVAYLPDGSQIATAGYDAVARLWDVTGGKELAEMIGGTFAVPAIAFTPDGASLAIVNGNIIRLRDVASTRFVRTIAAENPVYTVAFSPDGKLLASGDVANTVQVWDMAAPARPEVEIRESLLTLPVQNGSVSGVKALVWQAAFNPDGSLLAAASGDGRIRIWEAESGTLLAELAGHSQAATSLAFSPDGRWLASGGLDGRVIVWGIR